MNFKVITICLLFSITALFELKAQVPRKIIVEHFTNTLCSVCASRNPGFYSNLNNQPGILHISYHPSSPYSGCFHSQHNVSGNDGRTNYYGIYGSTPRLVIQGTVIAGSANYGSASIFNSYTGQSSPLSLQVSQLVFGTDSIQTQVVVKTVASHSLGSLSLYVALAEDTVFYAAPNGEGQQLRVFRKALSPNTGQSFQAPATPGDSIIFRYSSTKHPAWVAGRMFSVAILQLAGNRSVIQAENSLGANVVAGFEDQRLKEPPASVFPNPFSDRLFFKKQDQNADLYAEFYTSNGGLVKSAQLGTDGFIDTSSLPKGFYLLKMTHAKGTFMYKLSKE
jgi:hypothetical protein